MATTLPPSAVLDRLLIGGEDQAADGATLALTGVTHVVNCTNNLPNHFERADHDGPDANANTNAAGLNLKYFRVSAKDLDNVMIDVFFDAAVGFIKAALDEAPETKVLVHCHAGRSRSATIVLAYMIAELGHDLASAHAVVKAARTSVSPNFGFWMQLVRYELEVRGSNSSWPAQYSARRHINKQYEEARAKEGGKGAGDGGGDGAGPSCAAATLDATCGRFVLAETGGLGAATTAAVLSAWGDEVAPEHAVAALTRAVTAHGIEGGADARAAVPQLMFLLIKQHGAITAADAEAAVAPVLEAAFLDDVSLDVPFARRYVAELLDACSGLGVLGLGYRDTHPVLGFATQSA